MRTDLLARLLFQAIIIITIFSLWAAFALLVVNRLFYQDLPGYTIGRICIWELVAILIAFLISQQMIKKWGNIRLEKVEDQLKLTLSPNYGLYLLIYFLFAIGIGVWQFWLFSLKF